MQNILEKWKDFVKNQSLLKSVIFIVIMSSLSWLLLFIRVWYGTHGVLNPNLYEYILIFRLGNLFSWINSFIAVLILLFGLVLILSFVVKLYLKYTQNDLKFKTIWIAISYAMIVFPLSELSHFLPNGIFLDIIIPIVNLLLGLFIMLNLASFKTFSKKFAIISLVIIFILTLSLQSIFVTHYSIVPAAKDFTGTINNTIVFSQSDIDSICAEPKCLKVDFCNQIDELWECSFVVSITLNAKSSSNLKSIINNFTTNNSYSDILLKYELNDTVFSEVELSKELENQDLITLDVTIDSTGNTQRTTAINALIKIAEIQELVLVHQLK